MRVKVNYKFLGLPSYMIRNMNNNTSTSVRPIIAKPIIYNILYSIPIPASILYNLISTCFYVSTLNITIGTGIEKYSLLCRCDDDVPNVGRFNNNDVYYCAKTYYFVQTGDLNEIILQSLLLLLLLE